MMAKVMNPKGQAAAHYSRVAIWLHWIIAVLVVVNLYLGFYHEDFIRPVRAWMMYFHRSTGIMILGLSLGRLLWRVGHRPPPFDPVLKRWEMLLARTVHWLFYALLIALPLSGWLMSSAAGRPVSFFSLFDIGLLPVPQTDEAHDLLGEAHELFGKIMVGLILLHIAGALKHHFEGHRHLIGRIAPWLYRRS
jgi:cytochrome b561